MHDLNERTRKEFLLETIRAEEIREQERQEQKRKLNAGYLIAFNIMLVFCWRCLFLFFGWFKKMQRIRKIKNRRLTHIRKFLKNQHKEII